MTNVDVIRAPSRVTSSNSRASRVVSNPIHSRRRPSIVMTRASTSASAESERLAITMNDPTNASTRADAFERGARAQPEYDSSSWLETALVLAPERRGIVAFAWPWACITLAAATWTTVYELALPTRRASLESFEIVYQLVFTTMGFLLVFRLSRAAVRFWDCRTAFGNFNIGARNLVDYFLAHAPDDCDAHASDDVCRWTCAYMLASKQFLRGLRDVPRAQVAGVMREEEARAVESARHPPMFCATMLRRALIRAFDVEDASVQETIRRETRLKACHAHVNFLVTNEGALERLRATKLPMVYVMHLRTFLCAYCASMPFVFVRRWGWGTIPAVAAVSFALLGIEGAATECEIPFSEGRANHLRMDQYVQACFLSVGALLAWNDRIGDDGAASGLARRYMKQSRSNTSLEDLVIDVDKNV